MKKFLPLLIVFIMFLASCSSPESRETSNEVSVTSDSEQSEPQKVEESDFYKMMQNNNRPIAVMIDNDVDVSRPQMGLESAYMVYEIIVEGGKSRMMALFKEYSLDKVGPVRSSRHYFVDYALEHDAIYCHAGWSPKAQSDIRSFGVNNINGLLGNDGTIFWRDYTYDKTWHNLYSGVDKLYDMAVNNKGYKDTTDVVHDEYHKLEITPEYGDPVVNIDLPYSGLYRVSYEYDEENYVYNRYVDGNPHMSQTGEILTAKNIIIYQVQNFNLKDNDNVGRQDLNNIGSGQGFYITNGKMINIEWSKPSRSEKTVYTTEDGEELILNPGNTFIQIMPETSNITLS